MMVFLGFLLLVFAIGFSGKLFTDTSVTTWYPTLVKASWNPPPWVFGPVWTLLYVMIATSGWLIYRQPPSQRRSTALIFYAGQLVGNFLWSFLFFYLRSPELALIDIVILLALILATIYTAWRVSRLAALLLVPYALWVLYATSLNAAIWLHNP